MDIPVVRLMMFGGKVVGHPNVKIFVPNYLIKTLYD